MEVNSLIAFFYLQRMLPRTARAQTGALATTCPPTTPLAIPPVCVCERERERERERVGVSKCERERERDCVRACGSTRPLVHECMLGHRRHRKLRFSLRVEDLGFGV
jgi:hypothetical protein